MSYAKDVDAYTILLSQKIYMPGQKKIITFIYIKCIMNGSKDIVVHTHIHTSHIYATKYNIQRL